jgi:flagellar export protein FliJ
VKKFRFRLQRILSLKSVLRKQAQKALARAENNRKKEQDLLDQLHSEMNLRLKLERESRLKKLNVRHLEIAQRYLGQLIFLIGHQTRVVAEAEKVVALKRKKLIESKREERKYERLKEIRREDYTQELENLLQKETDEFARNICSGNMKAENV